MQSAEEYKVGGQFVLTTIKTTCKPVWDGHFGNAFPDQLIYLTHGWGQETLIFQLPSPSLVLMYHREVGELKLPVQAEQRVIDFNGVTHSFHIRDQSKCLAQCCRVFFAHELQDVGAKSTPRPPTE